VRCYDNLVHDSTQREKGLRQVALSLWEPLWERVWSLALSGRRTATRTPKAFRAPRSGAENVAQAASPGAAGTPHESAAARRKKNVHSKTYRGSYATRCFFRNSRYSSGGFANQRCR